MKILYPDNLPISAHREQIIETIKKNQVTVIEGDTGSGKTTQIAKMCLEALPADNKLIGCTQPRRIATSTVASRVAEELGSLGHIVGYKIRFHDHTSPSTKIKFMTDGVMLAETRKDRQLSQYSVIIIDEAHERNLNIDFLLGYIKQLIIKRPLLKVIITSATIDTQSFSTHFGNAPVITVSGRTYPVEVDYLPPLEDYESREGDLDHCITTVCDLFTSPVTGDILIFLPTEKEILECCRQLEQKLPQAVILPMYGRLPAADQRRIFQRQKRVKVVVATNVAETSVTVPGIRYVVDSGLARISQYNVRAKTTSLPISRISRASCDQRKGRCGRVGPGHCIRLYSEEDYLERDHYTVPELKRSNLAEVILQMISLDLGDPASFPFIDPPSKGAIREGYRLLNELGAIDDQRRLTKRGRIMAKLPIDPCISRIILEAAENCCLREIKIISAVLAIQDPRVRPPDHEKEADKAQEIFHHPHSDFMTLLNIWNHFYSNKGKERSWSRLKKFCKSYYLSFQRMREWIDLHDQLHRLVTQQKGFEDNIREASYEQIHKSLLAGFVRNIASKKRGHLYQGANNKELMIFPGSHQFHKGGQWLLAASFIETTRLYALTVASIETEWVESVAEHLCRYSWTNPRWHKKSGQVVADETVSLFGLVLSSGRKVNYGKKNKKNMLEARDIFIHSALVSGDLSGNYKFLDYNNGLKEKWQEAEEKLRVRSIVAEDISIHNFYSNKLPTDVYDQRTLNRFLKKKRKQNFLFMKDEDILTRMPDENALVDFPASRLIGSMQVRLEYHFEPGSERDGVTFRLPVEFAATVPSIAFEWLVPGLLQEKLTFLLRSLPKSIRKNLVPLADTVDRVLDDIEFGVGPLLATLEASVLKQFKMLIPRTAWQQNLPPHLEPRFLIFDEQGEVLCEGRNLKELLVTKKTNNSARLQPVLKEDHQKLYNSWQNSEHKTWNFHGLPAKLPIYTPANEVAGFYYPVLQQQPDRACVTVIFDKNQQTADEITRKGVLYLYRLQFRDQYKALKKMCTTSFSGPSVQTVLSSGKTHKAIIEDLLHFILGSIFHQTNSSIPTEEEFLTNIDQVKKNGLFRLGQEICTELFALYKKRRIVLETMNKIFTKKDSLSRDKQKDFFDHLQDIFPDNFLHLETPFDLKDVERQLQCLSIRLDRYYANPTKDAQKQFKIKPYLDNLNHITKKKEDFTEEGLEMLYRYKQIINEFRISLFAPELKTREKVSTKKLDQFWQEALSKW
ncbi:MAG: ATP-dependent RNA helicase HrpA [Desulforhopalus sp.]